MEILKNFNVCLVFYYKDIKNLNMDFYEEFFKHLKNTELIFHPKTLKNNTVNEHKSLKQNNHFRIYFNEQMQLVIGRNIFCVFLSKFDQLNSINFIETSGLKSINKINLTQKSVINNFIKNVTDNILEITLSKENYFDYFDKIFFHGSSLQVTREFEIIMDNDDLYIKQLKFQLFGNSTVSIRDKNLIEFGKEVTVNEKMNFIWFLSKLLLQDI